MKAPLRISFVGGGTDLPAFYQREYHGLHMGIEHPDPSTSLYRRGQGAAIYAFVRHATPAGPLRVAEVGSGTGSVLSSATDTDEVNPDTRKFDGCTFSTNAVSSSTARS